MEFILASRASKLADQLTLPIIVITGKNDCIIPTSDSIRLLRALPNPRLAVISSAGLVPHEEQPAAFMDVLQGFLSTPSF